MKSMLTVLLICIQMIMFGQSDTLGALFLGNSYTASNNLPSLVQGLAQGSAKVLLIDSYTPGGYTLDRHSSDTISLNKIKRGNWDFVILQEQSQIPTIPFYRDSFMFPAGKRLNDSISKYNSCATTIMYMTWGRRFGGRQCDQGQMNCSPNFVDFDHMQDSLERAYKQLADTISAFIAPVGISWRSVLNDTSLVLHTADNSHPNYTGSFLAACTFHSVIWNESPDSSSYTGSLSSSLATYLKKKADSTIQASKTYWNLHLKDVNSNFTFQINNDTVQFFNTSTGPRNTQFQWYFGDGSTTTMTNPVHRYSMPQTYTVTLKSVYCNNSDSISQQILINSTHLKEQSNFYFKLFPNPSNQLMTLEVGANAEANWVEVYDLNGIRRNSIQIKGDKEQIDLTNLASGIYLVQVIGKDQQVIWQKKIIKP